MIARFTARTPTISTLLQAVALGQSRKAAWEQTQPSGGGSGLCLRSGYRLWARLLRAQSRIRTALWGLRSPPPTADARPFAQMLAHLHVFGNADCVLAAFQLQQQRGIFG